MLLSFTTIRSLICLLLLVPLLLTASPSTAFAATELTFEQQVLEVLQQHPEAIINSIRTYQEQQRLEQQRQQQALLDDLKAHSSKFVMGSPTKGSSAAPVTLIEFSDFQCPFCAREAGTLTEFVAAHAGQVRLVYKHFPLDFHANAMPAAVAAWAAARQGKFWQFHDALFAQQDNLGDDLYLAIARQLGLNVAKFNADRTSDAAIDAIANDMELGTKLGLGGTPLLIMNGQILTGAVGIDELEAALQQVV